MTVKPDKLRQVAEDLRCVKCQVRPRVANRQVCRECRRQAEERDLQARAQLLPNRGASNHQQGRNVGGIRQEGARGVIATGQSHGACAAGSADANEANTAGRHG